ncbi:MAG: TlpA disulfide reductase family protein [Bacteroidota bacterium]
MNKHIYFTLLLIIISFLSCKNYEYRCSTNTISDNDKKLKKQKIDSINNRIIEKSLIIEKEIRKHFNYLEQFQNLLPPEIGDKYYDFSGVNSNGEFMKISDIKGKYILLKFTGTGCGACVKSIPELKRVYEKYHKSLEIVNFYADLRVYDWLKYVEKEKISWLTLCDGRGMNSYTWANYGIRGIPTFYLINKKGIIVKKWIGYSYGQIEEQIKLIIENNN